MNAVKVMSGPLGAHIVLDGVRYANFGGSSYLGLSGHPDILEAGAAALRSGGAGYQFARSYGIASPAHLDAEQEAAHFFGTEAAQFLTGGYAFGAIALHGFRTGDHVLFLDAWAHMSLMEAAAASGLKTVRYAHLQIEDLRAKLREHLRAGQVPIVLTDALFSTIGEVAPLDAINEAVAPYEGVLIIDESHSFGVLGESGRGALERFPKVGERAIVGGSTGKAFGVLGGIMPSDAARIERFRQAPAARGASVGLPAAAAMAAASFRHVARHPEIVGRLKANTARIKSSIAKLGMSIGDMDIPVVALTFETPQEAARVHAGLVDQRIYTLLSDYVGASAGGTIRIGIFADHSNEQLDGLVASLASLL
jgi:7-keto-8-aminopelargonate synthetase-like enzyme